ncbi:MAG: Flp family type IVb pilin [Xanthobacteraceae bacterium]
MKQAYSYSLIGLKRFVRDEEATTAIEYALLAACISIAIATAAVTLGETVRDDLFGKVDTAFQSVMP